jgi:hypothetical protein
MKTASLLQITRWDLLLIATTAGTIGLVFAI